MRVIHDFENSIRRPLCLAMGVFDGAHLGHQAIIATALQMVRETCKSGIPGVLTFDPHPDAILSRKGAPPLLTTTEEKIALLKKLGVGVTVIADFTLALAAIPAEEFVREILVNKLHACCLVVGEDWRFGAGGKGTPVLLQQMSEASGFRVRLVPPVTILGEKVSSTRIRSLLLQGHTAAARQLLGRYYEFSGEVVKGKGRGRQLGFPTANLDLPIEKLIPAQGVYACYAGLRKPQPAVLHIGIRPTFEERGARSVEVHLLAGVRPDRNLLGRRLRVSVVARLRGERRFTSAEALVKQMERDREHAQSLLLDISRPNW